MQVSMSKCKNRLAGAWFIGSGILFFILFFQTIFGRYGEHASEAWGWFFPNVVPTLSLMLGVFIVDALGKGVQTKTVGRFLFRLAFGLSSVYLLVVALTILSLPFVTVKPQEMVEFLRQSNLWLGPLQGLVSASIGVFFVKRQEA